MNIQKKCLLFITVLLAGCAGSIQQPVAETDKQLPEVSQGINACISHHQQRNNYVLGSDVFSIVDVEGLNYFILVAGELTNVEERMKYCHVDKESSNLVYGNNAAFKVEPTKSEFEQRYRSVAAGNVELGGIQVFRYKRIANQWRHLGTQTLSSF